MKAISLDELPRLSPWPIRLLGLGTEFSPEESPRSPERVLEAFEEGYAPLLAAYKKNPSLSLAELRQLEIGDFQQKVATSLGDDLYERTLGEAIAASDRVVRSWVVEEVGDFGAKTVVDLGCGWGYLISTLAGDLKSLGERAEFRGAELSPSGVALAQSLYSHHEGRIFPYDLTSGMPCPALATAEPPIVVVTSFACHQLPSSEPVVELLARWREKIAAVVSFEPEEDLFGEGLLGLFRRRYGQVRGYSADTLRVLRARDDVEILETKANAVGANALLPGTLSIWRFR